MDQAEQLRNIIKSKNQKPPKVARVITVTSGKGGVGKSNVAVNLAVEIQKQGKRVLIFDADFGLANVEVMFGAIPQYTLSDLIFQGKEIKDIITPGPLEIGFISGGSGIAGLNNLNKDEISYIIRNMAELDSLADVIIIDTGAGISDSVLEFVVYSSEVLLVTTPEPTSLTDSYSLLKALHRNPNFRQEETKIRVISNKVSTVQEGHALYKKLNTVTNRFLNMEIDFLGMIPQDKKMEEAVMQQQPVTLYMPTSKSAVAFQEIAVSLLNHKQIFYQDLNGIKQLLSKIINK
ncbi:MinD/ParA family protein [Anaerosacchariphilus polymeriproducens]|uniref:MinD/ParA family protein n=1 Tax=Anaerosacchariphilus polymeriproducens TaxID=1812858 RepID=A0A371AS83_9FIRM|nr:MinD/ParA family protein [Anaerosacchariphilus polymeriproducens]RDU22414.1 MinD/ParA family protein [Anaerosacchariphilus polymeriproducens]